MKPTNAYALTALITILMLAASACSTATPSPTSTSTHPPTPKPTATITLTPTATPKPTSTPTATKTPNATATQHAADLNAEVQTYFDKGYITTAKGNMQEFEDFKEEWAQRYWYQFWPLGTRVDNFFLSAHAKWSAASRNAGGSGCGFVFALQKNGDHYAVILSRKKILFMDADHGSPYSRKVGLTRGTGQVDFEQYADIPAEADLTLIVKGAYAYVLVNGELVGEYTLSKSKELNGYPALTLMSGTNQDFGTRCEMTGIHLWTPSE